MKFDSTDLGDITKVKQLGIPQRSIQLSRQFPSATTFLERRPRAAASQSVQDLLGEPRLRGVWVNLDPDQDNGQNELIQHRSRDPVTQ
jgi:hypothetical protein